MIESTVKNNDSEEVKYDPFRVVRVVHNRQTYIRGLVMGLKTVDLNKMRSIRNEREILHLKKLKMIAKKNDKYRKLAKVFSDRFKSITGEFFDFKKKRLVTYEYPDGKVKRYLVESDARRLMNIFDLIMEKASSDMNVSATMLDMMIDKWSSWDKASSSNFIGFIEKQCDIDNISEYYMKSRKKYKNKDRDVVFSEDKRVENVNKQRSYFASA